jgi:5-methyltetrahydropteroyltriglutamate--homocysteine methyltransferase
VLGLVSTKRAELEKPEAVESRIEEAARYFPRERLALSPQCGFASTMAGNLLSIDDERKKLQLVASVAKQVWGASAVAGRAR